MYKTEENNDQNRLKTIEDPQKTRLPKVLESLRRTKRIFKFEETTLGLFHDVAGLTFYNIWTTDKTIQYFKIIFYNTKGGQKKLPKKICNIGGIVSFMENDTQGVLTKKTVLAISIEERKIQVGRSKEERVIRVINQEKRKPHSLFSYCFKGSPVSDARGRDVHIGYYDEKRNQRMVPIQIKSSREYQDEHIKKYPKIPSIIVSREMEDEDIVELIRRICDGYVYGYVYHL